MGTKEEIGINTAKFIELSQQFEVSGRLSDLQETLRVRERISQLMAEVAEVLPVEMSKIDFSRFDLFLRSVKREAEAYWKSAPQGKPWRLIPESELGTVKKFVFDAAKQLDLRKIIPKSKSTGPFWAIFSNLIEQITRDIINTETVALVIQKIPKSTLFSGSYAQAQGVPQLSAAPKNVPVSDALDSVYLPDGNPLPEAYEDFLEVLKIHPDFITHPRYKYSGYAKQAKRKGDWKNVIFFGRVILKNHPENPQMPMLLAIAFEQIGDQSELREAISILDKILEMTRREGKNDAKVREILALLGSVKTKLRMTQRALPMDYLHVTEDMLTHCEYRVIVEYIRQARVDRNYVRAAFLSAELAKKAGEDTNSLRHLSSDLELAGLFEISAVIRGKIQWVDRNEGDDFYTEKLAKGLPVSYLDVTEVMLGKCEKKDLLFFAAQARKASDFKNAIRFQERLAELDPYELQTIMRLASDFYRVGDIRKALEANKKVADLMPEQDGKNTTGIIINRLEGMLKERKEQ